MTDSTPSPKPMPVPHACTPPNGLGRLVGSSWRCTTCWQRWRLTRKTTLEGKPSISAEYRPFEPEF